MKLWHLWFGLAVFNGLGVLIPGPWWADAIGVFCAVFFAYLTGWERAHYKFVYDLYPMGNK